MDLTEELRSLVQRRMASAQSVSTLLKEEASGTAAIGGVSRKTNTSTINGVGGAAAVRLHHGPEANVVGQFRSNALQLLGNVEQLRSFLMDVRVAYVDMKKFFNRTSPRERAMAARSAGALLDTESLSDTDRDRIEAEVKTQIRRCWEDLVALKNGLVAASLQLRRQQHSLRSDELKHLDGVLDHLQQRLSDVQELFESQQKLRYRQQAHEASDGYLQLPPIIKSSFDTYRAVPERVESAFDETASLDSAQRQLLERENSELQDELETMGDQARQIERSVMEISEMQRFFAAQLSQQNETVEQIAQLAERTRANVDIATGELQRASKRGVSFRTFVMLFLLVCSFALLYLHAINK
jgi:hypothetical protein